MHVTPRGLVIGAENSIGRTIVISHDIRTIRSRKYILDIAGYGKVVVSIKHSSHVPYAQFPHTTTLLHLSSQMNKDRLGLLGVSSIAASLAVKTNTGERFEVVYDDVVILEPWEETNQALSFSDCPCFEGRILEEHFSILVDVCKLRIYPEFIYMTKLTNLCL